MLIFIILITIIHSYTIKEVDNTTPSTIEFQNKNIDLELKWIENTTGEIIESPIVIDIDGDNKKEVIFSNGENETYILDENGDLKIDRTVQVGCSSTSPVPSNIDDNSFLEVFIGNYNNELNYINHNYQIAAMRERGGGIISKSPLIVDLESDGIFEAIYCTDNKNIICLNASYDKISFVENEYINWIYPINDFGYETPIATDLDGDGYLDVITKTQNGSIFCINYNKTKNWNFPSQGVGLTAPVFADIDGVETGKSELEIMTFFHNGSLLILDHNGEIRTLSDSFKDYEIYTSPILADLKVNGELWLITCSKNGRILMTDISFKNSPMKKIFFDDLNLNTTLAIADLDNNRRLEILISSDVGLFCLDCYGDLLKHWDGVKSITNPIIVDLDNDNKHEIIFGSKDENLYCYDVKGINNSSTNQWYSSRGSVYNTGQMDSDSDYIDDLTEKIKHLNPSMIDTDEDGLTDGDELIRYSTNPLEWDSDNDIAPDKLEIRWGTNPIKYNHLWSISIIFIFVVSILIIILISKGSVNLARNITSRNKIKIHAERYNEAIDFERDELAIIHLENIIKTLENKKIKSKKNKNLLKEKKEIHKRLEKKIEKEKNKKEIEEIICQSENGIRITELREKSKISSARIFNNLLSEIISVRNSSYELSDDKRIVRYVFIEKKVRKKNVPTILFLCAEPLGKRKFRNESRGIQEALRRPITQEKPEFEQIHDVEVDMLRSFLDDNKPDIVHFSAHGTPSGDLILCSIDKTKSENASPEYITRVLNEIEPEIKIVYFNVCNSSKTAAQVKKVIKCVIGMKEEITIEAATIFAKYFYQNFAYGYNAFKSFEKSKTELKKLHPHESHIPEIYNIKESKKLNINNIHIG